MSDSLAKCCALVLVLAGLGAEAAAVSVEFTPAGTPIILEEGKRFVLVNAGQNLQVAVRATGSEMITGYQLNFENSAADLLLNTWSSGSSWGLAFDTMLNTAVNDNFVAAGSFTANSLPSLLGTFQMHVPTMQSDYLLTVASNPGASATGFTMTSGAVPVMDYGDVVVRVRPAPPLIVGDYDRNGSVGPEDYNLWRSKLGSKASLHADGNQNGTIDAADYAVWRNAMGAGAASNSSLGAITAPEPTSGVLAGLAAIASWFMVALNGRR